MKPQATSASALVFEMKPAAIYARFSTELQNEKSTEDQIALCLSYAAGRGPREIAQDLNRENIDPPRGRRWNASTINGNAKRGTGLIFNELYAGRIIWNKVRMVKDPDTGKRLSRPNPREEWRSIDAPQLRIVEQSVWEQAYALKAEKGIWPAT
ncbi:recombinase family protein [Bradyrhizobium liaoningense]|uniref:recombinase family protein n=1 Tax=Bradyrhizobium liaoningense TaxID=43992 RepID=UPI001BA91A91|nr:recombinase family protein [Bradyrhizobium liaoningense]MBR0854134.1 recombinase family protein [Bradyrhizobium liaoningense]